MEPKTVNWLAVVTPLAFFAALMTWLEIDIYHLTGRIAYPIDDTYIHMAMARHLAQSGVWGDSLSGFSSASSAPGWTLLLGAAMWLLGPLEWIPLAVSALCGAALLVMMMLYLIERGWRPLPAVAGCVLFSFILPLPAMIALGMEHIVHILTVFALCWLAAREWESDEPRRDGWLFGLSALCTSMRYEGAFVVGAWAFLFFARRRWRCALGMLVFGALPPVLMGAVQLMNGWPFTPAPILQKSLMSQGGWGFFYQLYMRLFGQLFNTGHLLVPFIGCLAASYDVLRRDEGWKDARGPLAAVYLMTAAAHCATASVGWFQRYEAYLLAIAFMALAPLGPGVLARIRRAVTGLAAPERAGMGAAVAFGLLTAAGPFYYNTLTLNKIVSGSYNTYQQQYQMGLFLREYYTGAAVIANDIGAINFLADIRCLDGAGLGSLEPLLASMHNQLTPAFFERWARGGGVRIAVIYDSWWGTLIPGDWIKMGEWKVDKKITVGDQVVSFYAVNPAEAETLLKSLQDFSPRLPEGVSVSLAQPVN